MEELGMTLEELKEQLKGAEKEIEFLKSIREQLLIENKLLRNHIKTLEAKNGC